MATMSQEQFAQLMEMIQRQGRPQPGPFHSSRKVLDARYLKLQEFNGEASKWSDWAFSFKRTIRSMSPEAYKVIEAVEKVIGVLEEDKLAPEDIEVDVDKISGELYDILCQACTGDAMSLVRAVEDCQGFKAWHKLYLKYNPRTMARAIRLMGEVSSPKPIKELWDIDTELAKWEEKVKLLFKEFKEEVSEGMRIAIMTSMMPSSVQDFIYTNIDKDAKYDMIVERIRSVVGNKITMNTGPQPMDIGEVDNYEGFDGGEEEVGAVGMHVRCHKCEGWGHMARECPTKGKGKGGKGEAKGSYRGPPQQQPQQNYNKGDGKSGGKGDGKGKGYQGKCFKCGLVGHKAVECRVRQANVVQEVSGQDLDGEVEDIGGVWTIGAVHIEEAQVIKPYARHFDIEINNKYQALSEKIDIEKNHFDEEAEKTDIENNQCDEEVNGVEDGQRLTRESSMDFNVADVGKPLASAVKVCQAGNRVLLSPEPGGSYIENIKSGERMELRVEKGTFVFDVEFSEGEDGTITLDSGAGVNVWPKNKLKNVPMMPKKNGLTMKAANGTEIANYGRKIIKFRGISLAEKEQVQNIEKVKDEIFIRRT
jgi:hypothetical protein